MSYKFTASPSLITTMHTKSNKYNNANCKDHGYPSSDIHILHNEHESGPMETAMTLLHSAQKSKHINTLENCVHYFHHCMNI